MAKDKTKTGIPNKHLHARISYLQQASTLLAAGQAASRASATTTTSNCSATESEPPELPPEEPNQKPSQENTESKISDVLNFQAPPFGGLPLQLSSHLAQVARKSQIRLHPSIKHSLCKRCCTPLIAGETCTKRMENLSKGGRKPHADVLIMDCACCGATKRWPVGAERQKRKTERKKDSKDVNGVTTDLEGTQGNG